MPKRKSSPALYEVIRSGHGSMDRSSEMRTRRMPETVHHREPYEATSLVRWLQPGRSLQIPVGYVLSSVALVLVLVFVTYMIGYSRGQHAERLIYEEDLRAAGLLDDRERQPRDPALTASGGALVHPSDAGSRTGSPAGAMHGDSTRGRSPADWGPLVSDPREPGKMYYVLITTRERGARNLAEFCRDHGLEAYVLSSNNPAQFRVIALPGFRAEERTSDEVKRLRQQIHRIGDLWQASVAGATDLRSAYPSLYRGG